MDNNTSQQLSGQDQTPTNPAPELPAVNESNQPVVPGAATTQKPPFKKRRLFIGMIILVLLLVGGTAGYALWFNEPHKVLWDGFTNLLQAQVSHLQGTVTLKAGMQPGSETTFSYNNQSKTRSQVIVSSAFQSGSKTLTIGGTGVIDMSTVYLKLSGLKDLMQSLPQSDSAAFAGLLSPIINEVDNKWISITQDDLKQLAQLAPSVAPTTPDDSMTCVQNAISSFHGSHSQQDEIAAAYMHHPFIIVKQTLPDQNIAGHHYLLNVDETKAQAFDDAFRQTRFFKTLDKCSGGSLADETAPKSDVSADNTTVEVWLDQWTHQFTRLKISGTDQGTAGSIDMTAEFNKAQTIAVPKADITISKLLQDVQKAFLSSYDTMPF